MGKKSTLKDPEIVELSEIEKDRLIERISNNKLTEEDRDLMVKVLNGMEWLFQLAEKQSLSIKRIRRLFGFKTEKRRKSEEPATEETKNASHNEDSPKNEDTEKPKGEKGGGHGPPSAKSQKVSETIECQINDLSAGAKCPDCHQGKLHQQKPVALVKIHGQSPFKAVCYNLERLRCDTCGQTFKAELPKDVPKQKLNFRAISLLILFRFGMGLPHFRLSKMQKSLDLPLPPSTQWEYVAKGSIPGYRIYKELIRCAAQGELVYIDDTGMRIVKADRGSGKKSHTSNILCDLGNKQRISLFFSGKNCAGKNLDKVLKHRSPELLPMLQMSDALASNRPSEAITIMIHCLDHGRRKFVEIEEAFPQECGYVLDQLGIVYGNDRFTKIMKMNGWQRLAHHRKHSRPVMENLSIWLESKLAAKAVEENSDLGGAILYMLKRWDSFCGFYQYVDAPLSNAACERQVKTAICHRKNSLLYRTLNGALIGDINMSIIQTCVNFKINPLEYLDAIQKYCAQVLEAPQNWMPWNFQETLASVQ